MRLVLRLLLGRRCFVGVLVLRLEVRRGERRAGADLATSSASSRRAAAVAGAARRPSPPARPLAGAASGSTRRLKLAARDAALPQDACAASRPRSTSCATCRSPATSRRSPADAASASRRARAARADGAASCDGLALAGVRGGRARAAGTPTPRCEAALLAVLDRDLDRAEALLAAAVRLDVDDDVGLPRAGAPVPHARRDRARDPHPPEPAAAPRPRLAARPGWRWPTSARTSAQGGFLRARSRPTRRCWRTIRSTGASLRALVRLLADVREFPRAIELARRLARVEGQRRRGRAEAELRVAMAEAARAEGRSDEARKAVKRALRSDPKSRARVDRARRARGRARPREGGARGLAARARARPRARRAASTRSSRRPTPRSGARASSRPACAGCCASAPDDRGARLALARSLAARGDGEEALAELRRLLERDPGRPRGARYARPHPARRGARRRGREGVRAS